MVTSAGIGALWATVKTVAQIMETTFTMLGAVFRKLKTGLYISSDNHWYDNGSLQQRFLLFYFLPFYLSCLKVGLSFSHDRLGTNRSYSSHCGDASSSNARCKLSNIKPEATPQVSSPHKQCALQAQKQCKQSATSLLGWPKRSLFSIKTVQAERHELARMAEAQTVAIKVAKYKITGQVPMAISG